MNTQNNNTNTTDIIDFILSEQQKTSNEIQSQVNAHKTEINDQTFFLDNSPEGIMSKQQFLAMMSGINKNNLLSIKNLLVLMTQGRKFNTSSFAQTDKKGTEYYWIKLYGTNGTTEFRVNCFPGLDRLMQGYFFNLYSVSATLDGIYAEAKNSG